LVWGLVGALLRGAGGIVPIGFSNRIPRRMVPSDVVVTSGWQSPGRLQRQRSCAP